MAWQEIKDPERLGAAIKAARWPTDRKKSTLTYKQMSDMLGCAPATIDALEHGRRTHLPTTLAHALKRVFGVDCDPPANSPKTDDEHQESTANLDNKAKKSK